MGGKSDGWDWWSEIKLQILRDYLQGFTTAVRGQSAEAIFLDLFAGSFENRRRHEGGSFSGSSRIALETLPQFTRLAFFELDDPAAKLEQDIRQARPGDDRWRVFPGDCNATLPDALAWLEPWRWAPTFAFLDPRGLQVRWKTIELLAKWRADRKTKVELWMLFPETAPARVLGLRGDRGKRSVERMDALFGRRSWLPIHHMRRTGELTPDEARAEFVNLLRWQLQEQLRYRTTHALQLVNTSGNPVYTMVFATDSAPGDRIMDHVYQATSMRVIPQMQARAQVARRRRRHEESGQFELPGLGENEFEPSPSPAVRGYGHVEPWAPPTLLGDAVEVEDDEQVDDLAGDLDGEMRHGDARGH